MNKQGRVRSELRVQKDLVELAKQRFVCPHASAEISFPDGSSNLLKICVRISMQAGIYAGGRFSFVLRVPVSYPFNPPEVCSLDRVWHPNIDVETGRVAHSLLDRDWKPVLSLNTVIFGLQLLFIEPAADIVANRVAADTYATAPQAFAQHVRQTLGGGFWFGYEFAPSATSRVPRCEKRGRDDDDADMDDGDAVALSDTASNDDDDDGPVSYKRLRYAPLGTDPLVNGALQTAPFHLKPTAGPNPLQCYYLPDGLARYPISLVENLNRPPR
ncbi:ubiquitin-conjugating enzyme/RWD-like protein [Pelagophyceae sp. CCMP2097]|nr:ubiquitin-conjugating enzyme/RWD-like protein [Pelagophyceae sp. CCMP2097]